MTIQTSFESRTVEHTFEIRTVEHTFESRTVEHIFESRTVEHTFDNSRVLMKWNTFFFTVVCFLLGYSPGVYILYTDVSEHSVTSS